MAAGRLAEKPDLTLHALLAELRDAASWCHATRSGASSSAKGSASKKTVFASEQDRPDIARRRAWWKRYQAASILPVSSSSMRPGQRPT